MKATPSWPYDQIADLYDEDMGRRHAGEDVTAIACLLPEPPARILELGCGTGRIGGELLSRGYEVVELDRSRPMLQVLERQASGTRRLLAADARALPFRQGTFDAAVFGFCGFQYLTADDDVLALLTGLRRCLRPGAPFIFDIFINRANVVAKVLSLDYDRTMANGRRLRRWKRVNVVGPRLNRIERTYQIDEEPPLRTESTQRWYAEGEVEALLERGSFDAHEETCGYGRSGSGEPHFRLFRASTASWAS
jgi:SAM-dependent methyltransferase